MGKSVSELFATNLKNTRIFTEAKSGIPIMEENQMECDSDSDSDGSDFYKPIGRELEEYFKKADYGASIRSSLASGSTSLYSCKDEEDIVRINDALILNKQADAKYGQLQRVLYQSLTVIRQKIQENSQAIMAHSKMASNNEFSYLRCGKPYFKDKANFPAPDNADTILMKQSNMYDFYKVSSVPGWTVRDKTQLVNILQEMSREIRKKEIDSQIRSLQRENENENSIEIAKLEKQLNNLKKMTLKQIALPLNEEYDWEAVADRLKHRHTAQEYQSLWKLFFHPSINKSNWTKSEHQMLQNIATSHKFQDWDLIAKELNTGRTGYQCFIYFRTIMVEKLSNRKWTAEEIEYLHRVIAYYREGSYIPWGKVATAMDNRTKIQVYNKYNRMISCRKGRFLEEEDIIILNCYNKYGLNFKKMAEYLPGRSIVQLRNRLNILTSFRVSAIWTVEDDKKLLQIMANQDSNISYSAAARHLPGKDRSHIRTRYIILKRWMKAHPTADITHAPRKGARRLLHGYTVMSLNEALSRLGSRMETEIKKRKTRRLTIDSTEKDIEDGIIASLINEIVKEERCKKPELPNVDKIDISELENQNVTNLHRILILLKASLNIEKFKLSKYNTVYRGLGAVTKSLSEVKVKSYSKNQKVQTIELTHIPDIWGNRKLEQTKYVLPPNFSTITGCRVLLNNVSTKLVRDHDDEINLSLISRKNGQFQQAFIKLKSRISTLFLWPTLLSNEAPNFEKQQSYVPYSRTSKHKGLPTPTGITIPCLDRLKKKESATFETSNDIDLSEEENRMAKCNASRTIVQLVN